MLIVRGRRRISGRGIINTLIDKLPFSLEFPTYQFCGPGSKIEEKVAKNVPGKNKLDEYCKVHDIAYWKNKDLETRHQADRELADKAWSRFKSSDASLGEKAVSYLVTNAMKAKLAMGAGMKKTRRRNRKRLVAAKRKSIASRGSGVTKKRKRTVQRKISGVRVIPLPKRGGILQYLIPLLTGLSNIGSVAGTANELLKTIRTMKGSGLKSRAVLAPFKRGWGLYLRPYNPNC